MKLNYKRTILVGFAFFLICTFWQAYDTIIPKILTDKFGMSQANSGIIMALDNILALFMLPLFGAISDKCTSRLGRRTPFILIGTIAAAVALIALSFTDGMQLKNIEAVSAIDDRAALETLYDSVSGTRLEMPDGTEFVLSETFSRGDFASITSQVEVDGAAVTNPDYTNYVVPARHAYAHAATRANPLPLILFIGILLVALISMATFRSPAVALMPDVTIKPLRSKANAIINLMGTAGGILVLGMGVVFGTGAAKNALMPYATFFSIVAGIMLLALLAFMLTVREPKFVREMEAESRRFHIDELPEGETGKDAKRPLSKEERASLLLILASVVFWFMGYNAVISKYSVYAGKVLDLDYNTTLLLANIAAVAAYLPVGMIASKIGRKKTILAGIVMLATSFGVASFLREGSSALVMNCMFALAGIGWATINVNSFPMVVELSRGGDVGKYTGFYYTASMAAQTITPYFSGLLMDKIGMTTLFPYATIFVAIAFGTMLFVKHGDSRPEQPKSKLEALGGEE
ncbi:MAG: MFS transporter [Clostridium sp.]|jgi:maltose/moltooligosaccharide transporter|nr:MFS transporter [Clostridium sp.]MCI5915307.1 MFS transporter [Christensenella sp.]